MNISLAKLENFMRNGNTVLVFAPGHSEVDHRVRRSVQEFGLERSLLFIEKNSSMLIAYIDKFTKIRVCRDSMNIN